MRSSLATLWSAPRRRMRRKTVRVARLRDLIGWTVLPMTSRIGRLALSATFVLAGCSANASPIATPTATTESTPAVTPTLTPTPSPEPIPTPTNGPVPEIQTIGFGTGGSGCDLTGIARTFSTGVTVYMVATFSPLPDSVTITVSKDAGVIYGPTMAKLDPSVGCETGRLPNLEVGNYKVVMTVPASEMPPLTGEFDVTP